MHPSPTPSPIAHHAIESITITAGFLGGNTITFDPALNTIIGGHGSGKSSILELIRFTLGAPLPPSREPIHNSLLKRLLPPGARASVAFRTRHGMRYTCSRALGEPPRITGENGEIANVSLDSDLFKIEVYAQGEIETIGRDPTAQLALIDRFADAEMRVFKDDLVNVLRRLDQNAAEITRLEREIGEGATKTRELPSIQEALKGLRKVEGPDAADAEKELQDRVLRGRQRTAIAEVDQRLQQIAAAYDTLAVNAKQSLLAPLQEELIQGANAQVVGAAFAIATKVAAAFEQSRTGIENLLAQARESVAGSQRELAALHATQDKEGQIILDRVEVDRSRAVERNRLEARELELSAAARRLDEQRMEQSERKKERAIMLDELTTLRKQRRAVRVRVAEEITRALDGCVRISILDQPNRDAYGEVVHEALKGANIRPAGVIDEIVSSIPPLELRGLVETNQTLPIEAIDTAGSRRRERAQQILDRLRASGKMHEIETVALEDVPTIQLRTRDGYQESAKVSPGQRCTCILPMLLLQAEGPLLIDQPEDNVDPSFITKVLVPTILKAKKTRQLFFVTHVANIPVLCQAERINRLESDDVHSRVVQSGDSDDLRKQIEDDLEGGKEAFLLRGQHYGHFE